MPNAQPQRIRTISEYHRVMGLPKPDHPLISLVDYSAISHSADAGPISLVFDFYSIALKRSPAARMKYGHQDYDFDEGVMFFIAPGQVFGIEIDHHAEGRHSGWILLVHPDFLWNTTLAKTIRKYEYFDYSVAEALFASEKEEAILVSIMQNIRQEYRSNIDGFSQNIIIAQLELLLSYAERFYHRQFITRKITGHRVLERLEEILAGYFNGDALLKKGLPTVQYIAGELNMSPNYLSAVLKVLTGQSTQQHIHDKLIEKAKEKLSTTDLPVNEIAYELGFEYPQSFSKLFKTKTSLSPLAFRQSFN